MASPTPSERRFEKLSHAVHELVPLSTLKGSHRLTAVFDGSLYNRLDLRRVLAEFEANGEKPCPETSDTSEEIMYDQDHKSVDVYLALSGVGRQSSGWLLVMQSVELVSIPDSVVELCEECFLECKRLSRVTFGESSSLKLIGKGSFRRSGVQEIHIPDGVEKLCEECFHECTSLSRVTFGESSSLKLIGHLAFKFSGVTEIHIPNGIERLLRYRRAGLPPSCRVMTLA